MSDDADTTTTATLGKGLDVGTSNLVCAYQEQDGSMMVARQRNVFVDVKPDPFTQSMLRQQNIPYVAYGDSFYILGEPAFDYANIIGREVRRPMSEGMISPGEDDALPVVKLLLEALVGPPRTPGESMAFSVPAEPVDSPLNVVYHQGVLESILRQLGYEPFPMYEGLSVVFSELAEQEYTGIGISFGAGMANVCIAYRSIPAINFSVCRSGDWIDRNAAGVLSMKTPRVTVAKERGMSLMSPSGREEQAVAIFYRDLITYIAQNISSHLKSKETLPQFPGAIDIVLAGGTTMIDGFLDVFKDEFNKTRLDLAIGEIRLARDPLNTTARGCLLAAMSMG